MSRFSESFLICSASVFLQDSKKGRIGNLTHQNRIPETIPWQSANKAQGFDHTVGEHICLNKDLSGIHNRYQRFAGNTKLPELF